MAETAIRAPIFEFTGNHLCLDFANTAQDRASSPRELLNSYNDLVFWSQQGLILTDKEAERLREVAAEHRAEADGVLQRAIDLREAIYRILIMVTKGSAPEQADLDTMNTMLSRAMTRACIVSKGNGFAWDWLDQEPALDRMLWPVVRSTAELLASDELDAVRVCASNDCEWLFMDTSKNHSRRWCDMKSCGNRAKARKHYMQRKQAT